MNYTKFKRGWKSGQPETFCGHGSKVNQTEIQREWIPRMVEKYDIHSIVDIGAGDLNWMRLVQWPYPVEYQPFDLVPRAPGVKEFDLIYEVPPDADLVMCLWLLNHLPEHQARAALKNLMGCKCKYLMYTWWPAMADFLDFGAKEYTVLRTKGEGIKHELRMIEC